MKKLRIHYFQHVPYEGLGSIEEWVSENGHSLSATRFFMGEQLPEVSDLDMLIVMGGSMSVTDDDSFPWLIPEKHFIRKAIDAGKTVLGICLGSQLVSSALGARVYQNKVKEIGWFDVNFTPAAQKGNLFFDFGEKAKVFHWHGDTFDLPAGAIHMAWTDACKNQAYVYKDKVVALQFHMEPTSDSLDQMIKHGKLELKQDTYIQTEDMITGKDQLLSVNKKMMFVLLSGLAEQRIESRE